MRVVLGKGILSHDGETQVPEASWYPALSMGTVVVKDGIVTGGSLKNPENGRNW
jgi:hypothetical protein